jgi:hypothetical protein
MNLKIEHVEVGGETAIVHITATDGESIKEAT